MPRIRPPETSLWLALFPLILLSLSIAAHPVSARDQIRIVGSSTVFPFSTAVAERFGRTTAYKTPIVESTGSGGGLKLFCAGTGDDTPDIANASRRIKASEIDLCSRNGVTDILGIRIGFDGIVIAQSKVDPPMPLSRHQLFLALARRIPLDGRPADNPNRTWREVDPHLPDRPIEILGPPPTSGTRDAFVELAMEAGAKEIPELAALARKDEQAFKRATHALREDGAYIEAGENDNLIVQKLTANPTALGIFGFSFLDQNADRIQASPIDGIAPSFENIAAGRYPISRSLHLYVKKAHLGRIPGLEAFLTEFTSEKALGPDGYLADRGLIPLPAPDREAVRKSAAQLETLRR